MNEMFVCSQIEAHVCYNNASSQMKRKYDEIYAAIFIPGWYFFPRKNKERMKSVFISKHHRIFLISLAYKISRCFYIFF